METFAAKVRYGGEPRFDPMLEERGGWATGEGPKGDTVMSEAVIEVLAEASKQISGDQLNPFKEQAGEILPGNMERNFSGFLVRKDAITFKVNTNMLNARIAILKEQLLIAKFLGPKPTPQDLVKWLTALNQDLGGSEVTFCMNVGKGFFFLKSEDSDAIHNALMMSPFKSKWGTCMLQSWVPGFNPDNPSNLAFPTWVALRKLPFEHHDQALAIAETLGEVIGIDTANENARDPRFCINLVVSRGWVTSIDLETEGGILPVQKVIVDYDKLPMRCKACHSWKHRVRDCKEIQKNTLRGGRRPTHAFPQHQQDKGKNIVTDEDGFQQVRNRKNTRRNIFDAVDDDMRSSAYALREEIRAAQYRSRQREWRNEGQGANLAMREEGEVEGCRDPGPVGEKRSSEFNPGNHTETTKKAMENEGSKEMELDGPPQKESEETAGASEGKALTHNGSTEKGREDLPLEGRGDPASTMLWSPRKHAGHKRPLDEEAVTSDSETSEEEEAMSEGSQEVEDLNEGEQPLPAEEPQIQAKSDGDVPGSESQPQVGAESSPREVVADEGGARQEVEAASAMVGKPRGQKESERFMGRKIRGIVPQTTEEPERPEGNQSGNRRMPSQENFGEGGHKSTAGTGRGKKTCRSRGDTNSHQEDEMLDAEGKEFPDAEEEEPPDAVDEELPDAGGEELERLDTEEEEVLPNPEDERGDGAEKVGRRWPLEGDGRGEATPEGEQREETQRGRLPPPNPKSQGGSGNGLNVSSDLGRSGIRGKQSNSQGERVTEGETNGQGKGLVEESYGDPPKKPRSARWYDETAERHSYQEASIWEKQAWEGAPQSYYNTNKTPMTGKWGGIYPNYEVDQIDGSYPETGNAHSGSRPLEVIKETQILPNITNQGSIYKDIMASIGLDSPNTSTESRREERNEQNRLEALVNTPIRTSASSLIALGQHVLNSRQGRLWKGDTSPR